MKSFALIIGILGFLLITTTPAFARSGCCSHHGGVSGCGCADGTPLSDTCAPYYPECYNGGQQQTQSTPQTQTYVAPPTAVPTYKPFPTVKPKPTIKPFVKKKTVKHTVKKKPTPTPTRIPTPTPTPQKNFFQMLFGW